MGIKEYVFEFANDMLKDDEENALMREDIKAKRKERIEEILFEYKGGYSTTREALWQLCCRV